MILGALRLDGTGVMSAAAMEFLQRFHRVQAGAEGRSILANLLPVPVLRVIDSLPAKRAAGWFNSDAETPDFIWGPAMRRHLLLALSTVDGGAAHVVAARRERTAKSAGGGEPNAVGDGDGGGAEEAGGAAFDIATLPLQTATGGVCVEYPEVASLTRVGPIYLDLFSQSLPDTLVVPLDANHRETGRGAGDDRSSHS